MVYTGNRENVPEILSLSDLYGGTGNGDIVDQYVRFCKITDEEALWTERQSNQRDAAPVYRGKCIGAIFGDTSEGGSRDYGDIV